MFILIGNSMSIALCGPRRHHTLTHWGRVPHICVGKLTIIGSDNGLSPGRRQAIIRTSAGILLIGPLGTNFSELLIGIQALSFTKMHLKISSAKRWPFCPGLNVLISMYKAIAIDRLPRHCPEYYAQHHRHYKLQCPLSFGTAYNNARLNNMD